MTIGFATIAIGALLGILVFGPVSAEAADAIDSGDEVGTKSATSRLATFGAIDTLLFLTTITVMVLRLTL